MASQNGIYSAPSLSWKGKKLDLDIVSQTCPRKQTTEPKLLILVTFFSGEVTSYTDTSYCIYILWEVSRRFFWATCIGASSLTNVCALQVWMVVSSCHHFDFSMLLIFVCKYKCNANSGDVCLKRALMRMPYILSRDSDENIVTWRFSYRLYDEPVWKGWDIFLCDFINLGNFNIEQTLPINNDNCLVISHYNCKIDVQVHDVHSLSILLKGR